MEDKGLYNKVMLGAFCMIVILLLVGMFVWIREKNAPQPADYVPEGKAQMLEAEPRETPLDEMLQAVF